MKNRISALTLLSALVLTPMLAHAVADSSEPPAPPASAAADQQPGGAPPPSAAIGGPATGAPTGAPPSGMMMSKAWLLRHRHPAALQPLENLARREPAVPP